ncbi:MAG: ATP-binding protein [Nannocystaceae bacterium]
MSLPRSPVGPGVRSRPEVIPWLGRLQTRVVVALVLLGILVVGACGYLAHMTVRYFERLGTEQTAVAREVIERARPVYRHMVAAKRSAYRYRTELLARDLERAWAVDSVPHAFDLGAWLAQARAKDIEALAVEARGVVLASARGVTDAKGEAEVVVPIRTIVHRASSDVPIELHARFIVPSALARDFDALGALRGELGTVEVAGARVDREDAVRAVAAALAAASGLLFLVALAAGIVVARVVTRRVSDVSAVMRRVAAGDRHARAADPGGDEIARMATDLNTMLDELEQAHAKVAYLQRIGAWQGIARRIAHEIKNPLTPIQLAAQQLRHQGLDLLRSGDPAFEQLLRDSVDIIDDEVDVMRRWVHNFSQFARVPKVHPEPMDLRELLRDFERAYGYLSDGVGDRFDVIVPEAELLVLGDQQLLKQVLVNLVENAVLSAREAVNAVVHVRVEARRIDEVWAQLAVADNGPGIAIERREAVFEPHETTREEGSGLGLAIVKKIVLDHGGHISVVSSDLGGACLRVRLLLATVRDT